MPPRILALLFLTLALVACKPAQHSTLPTGVRSCGGVPIPESIEVDGASLTLNGTAVREASIMAVDVYVGALYLEHTSANAEEIVSSEQRKRLVMRFLRDVTRQDFLNAFERGFAANASAERLGLRSEIEEFVSYFEDMEEHAEVLFDYTPGVGVRVSVNGELRGTIVAPAFQRALLLVFLGREPPSRELKAGLLGGACN